MLSASQGYKNWFNNYTFYIRRKLFIIQCEKLLLEVKEINKIKFEKKFTFQLEVELSVRADKLAPAGTEVKLQLEIIAGSSSTKTVTLKVSLI